MDFEIEGSDEDSYHYESYSNPNSYSSGKTLGKNPPKKSSTFFGAQDDDNDMYDFEYEEPPAPKGAPSGQFSAFSPQAGNNRKAFSTSQNNISTDYSEEDSELHPPSKVGGNNALRVSVQSNESALERAQNMLNKYNNKSTNLPSSNFKGKRIPTTFDEDDLSMEEELNDTNEMDMSESMEQSSGMKRSGTSTNLHKPASSSAAATTAKPYQSSSKPTKYHDESAMSNIVGEESVEDVYSEDEEVVEEEEVADDDEVEDEYGNEDFDDADELGESLAHDDDEDDDRKATTSKVPVVNTKVTKVPETKKVKKESDDENEDYANQSYSRMIYGPEDGVDSDEVEEDVTESSKPKIFSFAELGDVAGWEPSSSNIANKSDLPYPDLPAVTTKPVSISATVSGSDTTKTTVVDSAPKSSGYSQQNSAPSKSNQDYSAPKTSLYPSQTTVSQPSTSTITSSNPSQPAAQTAQLPSHQPQQHQQAPPIPPHAHPQYPTQPPAHYPPHYPPNPPHYPYGPPPSNPSESSQTPPNHQPYGYPYYPPQSPYPPPPPYGYHPYGYPYPPPPPMPYHPYSYPYPPMDPFGAMNQQAALLASMNSTSSLLGNNHGHTSSSSVPLVNPLSQMSNQPIILELLQELSKVQEEANWTRKKLAETMMMLKDVGVSNSSPAAKSEAATPSLSLPKGSNTTTNAKGRYGDDEDDNDEYEEDEDYSNEYSEDFEVSNLNLSTSFRRPPSVKGITKKNTQENAGKKTEQVTLKAEDQKETVPQPPSSSTQQENESPTYLPKQSEFNRFSHNSNPVRGLGIPSFTSTNEFLDPFTDSIARSFLASQELLRTKLESLRLRVQMTNTMSQERQELETFSTGMQSSNNGGKSLSSLDRLKSQFESKKKQSEERLLKILKEAYPDLDEAEALKMSKMIE